jgi:AmmeMemoRadiSam system protein A
MSALAPESRSWLLKAARRAIAVRLGVAAETPGPPPAGLETRRGLFVTLVQGEERELRGCIGFVEPRGPLVSAIVEAAEAAAFRDPRFEPLRAVELEATHLEVSILSVPAPMAAADVVVGTHGLIVRQGGRSGLLLPQVPVEHHWDRETFLSFTCRKAGLPPDAWRSGDALLLGFTAEVFGEC